MSRVASNGELLEDITDLLELRRGRLEYTRNYNFSHKEALAAAKRKYRYGLLPNDYQHLLITQQGRCAICSRTPEEAGEFRALCVDHDHATGVIRGLVCNKCNRHIAWYEQFTLAILAHLEKSNI